MIHGYPIDGAMKQGGYASYRWFVYITTILLREVSSLHNLHCGTPELRPGVIYIDSSVGTSLLFPDTDNVHSTCFPLDMYLGSGQWKLPISLITIL